MSFQLKNFVSPKFVDEISIIIAEIVANFDGENFKKLVFDEQWENRELKQRTHHIASVLRIFLHRKYSIAAGQLVLISNSILQNNKKNLGIEYMFLPDFIEDFGTENLDISVNAIEEVTKLFSCEFAVRPLYKKYPEKMMQQTLLWAKNDNHKVRRLASEGCRSKLPWAMAVPFLKNNPNRIIEILKILINDESDWVRLSVSNNLNDISKDYPELVLNFAEKYIGINKKTDKLLKHALRTLLKNGNTKALELFGYKYSKNIVLKNFKILNNKVRVGEDLNFSFTIENIDKKTQQIRIEYVIYYQKANRKHNPKIYQITEKKIKKHEEISFERKRSFKPISTRKFHCGSHKIAIIINGKEQKLIEFELVE